MMKKHCLLLITCLLFFQLQVRAQESKTWSLQDCIEQALEENLNIRQSKLETDQAKTQYQRNKEDRYPSVSFGGSHTYNFGRTIDRFTNDFATEGVHSTNLGVSANFTVFDGFRKQNTLKKNQKEIQARKKGVEEQKWQIRKNVIQAYMDVLLNKALLQSSKSQLKVLQNEVEASEKQVKAGDQTKADLLELKAELANQEVEVTNAENNLELAHLQLKQLMELSSDEDFQIEKPELPMADEMQEELPETTRIYQAASEHHPGLQRRQLEKEVAAYEQDIARADYYPTIDLRGSMGSGYSGNRQEVVSRGEIIGQETIGFTSGGQQVLRPVYDPQVQTVPFMDQMDNNFNQSISLSLNIPIYDGSQANYQKEQARLNRQLANQQLQQMEKQLLNDIETARTDARAAAKEYEAARQSVQAHRTSFENAKKRLEAGMGTPYRYSEALSRLQEAESRMLRARYEMLFKRGLLDMFMGKPVEVQ